MEDLREMMETVSGLSSDRLGILEQALPLAEHFHETHSGLSSWLDDMEHQVNMLAMPALRPDQIAQQQDKNEVNSIADIVILYCPFFLFLCHYIKFYPHFLILRREVAAIFREKAYVHLV